MPRCTASCCCLKFQLRRRCRSSYDFSKRKVTRRKCLEDFIAQILWYSSLGQRPESSLKVASILERSISRHETSSSILFGRRHPSRSSSRRRLGPPIRDHLSGSRSRSAFQPPSSHHAPNGSSAAGSAHYGQRVTFWQGSHTIAISKGWPVVKAADSLYAVWSHS